MILYAIGEKTWEAIPILINVEEDQLLVLYTQKTKTRYAFWSRPGNQLDWLPERYQRYNWGSWSYEHRKNDMISGLGFSEVSEEKFQAAWDAFVESKNALDGKYPKRGGI